MNVTKNKLIVALNYIGIYPKSTLNKENLTKEFNDFYEHNINSLVLVINPTIYGLLKKLVKSKENFISVSKKFEDEIRFLEEALIIDMPVKDKSKTLINFSTGMKEKFANFINSKNELTIKANNLIVNLIINLVEVYGLIQDYEIVKMINKYLSIYISVEALRMLLDTQIDLKSDIYLAEYGDETFIVSALVDNPQDILEERYNRDLTYKDFSLDELLNNSLENILERQEPKEVIQFLKSKGVFKPYEIVMNMIVYIMCIPKINIQHFYQLINLNFENIDEANEYLKLLMDLHNNIPHYSLYGYSPAELSKILIKKQKDDEEKSKESKVGRNDPCPCGSGKKYKKCCMTKVIHVDFNNE